MEIFLDKGAIEIVAVASQFCALVEKAPALSRPDFLGKLHKMLSLAYLKASMIEPDEECVSLCEDGCSMAFLSEYEYEHIRGMVSAALGARDSYISIYNSASNDSGYEQAEISLCIADIYHAMKDFAENFRSGSEESAKASLAGLISDFREFWGYRCLSAAAALHAALYSGASLTDCGPGDYPDAPGGGFLDRFMQTKR